MTNDEGPKTKKAKQLRYTVTRGRERGVVLTPPQHKNGRYVASMTRFKRDYEYVDTIDELIAKMRGGKRIRMSNQNSAAHRSPSLIKPGSIEIVDGDS